ncbi:MXAN_6230/SCO0854 family RING domain-containing protein [Streptomyces hesseae]|uniref:MXAN_6230/SCO0854 family RING domain-containing protein n=1 Tax=Streptomyces hesseae TaxID=3075519 RepID=A0ABU2SWV5_9ACTN|nr:MXAN_6230/SCO0854 family RING domain-containing protein [Streptomyces sp. DSM 40473]MDT0453476.1 MXAN_6230/SCO0854 family RING domain-containing protein [Streptomyces sp. DSM 40473]
MSTLHAVLLRRARTVYVDHEPSPPAAVSAPAVAAGLTALEGELLDRGHALTEPLRTALAGAGARALADTGRGLLHAIDAQLGADRTHMPLFRGFPRSVPEDTDALFVDRVFSLLLQRPRQPCVLCGTVGAVLPVAPCAHLVCRSCWDGADYTGCPLCHRRVDRTDPFLRPARPAGAVARSHPDEPLRLLVLGTSRTADAAAELAGLLARATPLSPRDRDDVKVLLAHAEPGGLDWLPADMPVRETRALVLGTLLRDGGPTTVAAVRERLPELLTTATDVLRLLWVWSGGEADLLSPPRLRGVPRGLRRELLAVLDGLATPSLVEDLLRHPEAWKRAAELLHPFEGHARHPRAALAFAALRGTEVSGAGALGEALLRTAAEYPEAVAVRADSCEAADGARQPGSGGSVRIVARTWAGRVEEALRRGDAAGAVALLARRPGELVRRLDQLLRVYGGEELAPELGAALEHGLPKAGPGPLLGALGALRGRHLPSSRRVFFPRGRVGRARGVDDVRPPLPAALVARVAGLLEAEVVRRLGAASRYELAVLDPGLASLPAPFAERSSATSLVAVPRGSELRLPEGRVLRLFLHWMEPEGTRVDLDLSVAFFDEDWRAIGLCDYTRLRYRGDAAVHSGDLTSAPPPDGATEYVDLDLTALAEAGARYAVPVVFSFNDVPFDELPDAFAGFMTVSGPAEARDASYDPRAVRQRFDLAGESRICAPMIVDLADGRALWTDVHLPGDSGVHDLGRHGDVLGALARDLWGHFTGGARVTLWDVACWHAAARCDETVVVRCASGADGPGAGGTGADGADGPGTDSAPPGGELWRYRRRDGEGVAAFAARLRALGAPDSREAAGSAGRTAPARGPAAHVADGRRVFLAFVEGDELSPVGATGTVYRLFPGAVDACAGPERVTAGGLLAELA